MILLKFDLALCGFLKKKKKNSHSWLLAIGFVTRTHILVAGVYENKKLSQEVGVTKGYN